MSMLAERKRKTKWSINPRGNIWSNDNNKFGQKMLEKMGWQQGKGLGAKEDGIKEQIKVSYKNDSKGMGFKDNGEQWTEHESKFSELLEALGGKTNPDDIKLNSLEKKSQTSRARVHYHKFTRGKDLSRYSEKDLANIFGKRNLNEINKEDDTEIKQEEENKDDSKNNIFLFNGGSMQDYFKKKLSNFTNFSSDVTPKDSESEDDSRPAFGFGFKSEKSKKEDSLKNNSTRSSFVSYIEEGTVKRKAENHLENDILSPKKKIKKFLEDTENLGLSNPGFNPMATPIKVKKHKLSTIEEISEINDMKKENGSPVEKISKRKLKDRRTEDDIKTIETSVIQDEEVDENQVKKKKKKKKLEDTNLGIFNPLFESNVEGNKEIVTEVNEFEVKRTKKTKKKNKDKENKFENGAYYTEENGGADFISEHSNIEGETNPYEVKIKKKKKKKPIQNDDKNLGLTNPIFEDNVGENTPGVEPLDTLEQNVNEKKKKRKKEKKSENFSLENPCFNDVPVHETVINVEENPFEIKRTKKKKNKKKDLNDDLKDNSIDDSVHSNTNDDSIDENCDLMLNVVSEPQLPKPNKQTEKVGSIEKVRTKRRKSVRFSDVTQEMIIPNNDELREMENSYQNGIDNENFDSIQTHVSENLETISKQLDMFQAEIENDINEKKMSTFEELVVGEIGNPDGENEKLPDSTRLKFKYANLETKTPMYQLNKTGAKKSYKHLIKGDIVLKFKNTNLHEITGYASSKTKFGRNK